MRRKATRRFEKFRSAAATELFISLDSLFFGRSCCDAFGSGVLHFELAPNPALPNASGRCSSLVYLLEAGVTCLGGMLLRFRLAKSKES